MKIITHTKIQKHIIKIILVDIKVSSSLLANFYTTKSSYYIAINLACNAIHCPLESIRTFSNLVANSLREKVVYEFLRQFA